MKNLLHVTKQMLNSKEGTSCKSDDLLVCERMDLLEVTGSSGLTAPLDILK